MGSCYKKFFASAAVRSVIGALVLALFSPTVLAQHLDTRKKIRSPQRAALQWENLSHHLQHVSGKPPEYLKPRKLFAVTLSPGEHVDFRVPSHQYVRLISCDGNQLNPAQTEILTSNGSGLFRKLAPAVSQDGQSMIAAPDQSGVSIARVHHALGCDCPVTIAIFNSYRDDDRSLDYYQCPVICDCKEVLLSDDRGRTPRRYLPLKPGRRYPVNVAADTRLRLESRLQYDGDASRHQFYWIKVYVDGVHHRTLLFDTLPSRMHRDFVDGREHLIGEREFAWLDIASSSESIEVELSHAAWFRADAIGLDLVNPAINSRFNFPEWERHLTDEDAWLEEDHFDDHRSIDDYLAHGSGSIKDSPGFAKAPTDPCWDPWLNYPRLLDVARDNSIVYGGLRATMWMRAIAAKWQGQSEFGDEPTTEELLAKLQSRFTYFRDLSPVDVDPNLAARHVTFANRTIRRPGQNETETVIGEQHVMEAASRISKATLFPLSTDPDCECGSELTFRPAEDLGTSMLRVIVDRHRLVGDAVFQIQFDDRSPFELRVHHDGVLEEAAYIPTRAEAGLASLNAMHSRYDSGPWGGPFAAIDESLPMTQAGVAEFLLPADVKVVKITTESATDPTVYVGMQCLVANFTELSESAYLKYGHHAAAVPEVKAFAQDQLHNNSLDLQRLLSSHRHQISSSIAPRNAFKKPSRILRQQELESARTSALELASDGNWTGVIEVLSNIVNHTEGEPRRQAILARTQVLDQVGESFLASRERRGWYRHSGDALLRKELLSMLIDETADQIGGGLIRETLLAYAATEFPDDRLDLRLARQLADNGRFRFALLAIPPNSTGDEVDELVLRCSFQLRWWKTYNAALKRISDVSTRNYYGAMKSMSRGQYKRAFRLLESAGQRGQKWLQHWKYGDTIHTRLKSSDLMTRMSVIEDWESWMDGHPGHRTWKNEHNLVKRANGTATIYSRERDLRMEFFRADRDQESTIAVHGPATIRIECRPLHEAMPGRSIVQRPIDPNAPPSPDAIELSGAVALRGTDHVPTAQRDREDRSISGILEIYSKSQLERLPLLNNQVSDTLIVEGHTHRWSPGGREIAELRIPAGLNRIRLRPRDLDVLFRVQVGRPEIASPILPPVNATTLAAVIAGQFGADESCCREGQAAGRIADSVRRVPRDASQRSVSQCFSFFDRHNLSLAKTSSMLEARMGELPAWHNRLKPTDQPFVMLHQDALTKQAISFVFDQPSDWNSDPQTQVAKCAAITKMLDTAPSHRQLRELQDWLQRGSQWNRFQQFDQRAGIFIEKVSHWRPTSPALRVRKSLLAIGHADLAIVGDNRVEIDLSEIFSPEIEVTVRRPRVSFLPTHETTVHWQVDDGPTQSLVLRSDTEDQKFRVPMANGQQTLALWMPHPFANHYAVIDVQELLASGQPLNQLPTLSPGRGEGMPVASTSTLPPREFSWHVATTEEPLQFRVDGPGLVRIDQLQATGVKTDIIPIGKDGRAFTMTPADDGRTGRYRIYTMGRAETTPPIFRPSTASKTDRKENHWIHAAVDEVFGKIEQDVSTPPMDLLGLRSPDASAAAIAIRDLQMPGTYDTGTTGMHFGYRERRALDEFPIAVEAGRFFELALSNRKYDPWRDQYRTTEFLIRPRIGSGPTFGFRHDRTKTLRSINHRPDNSADRWGPTQLSTGVFAFGQYAGTPLVESGNSFPWTTGFNASVSRRHHINDQISHRPTARIFGRLLSESSNAFDGGELDQDIFTTYKSDHRYGLQLSDRYVWQTHLDQRFYLRPSIRSNEDQIIPDNAGFEVGADQLFGPVQMHVGYRATQFFADNDRSTAATQNVLRLDLLTEHWTPQGQLSQFDLSITHAINDGTSFGFSWNRYFSSGRVYRDFAPGEILFRSLREERATRILHSSPD